MAAAVNGDGTRRRSIRLQLHEGVTAKLRVVGINQNPVKTKYCKVLLTDIGPGGFRFATTLRFTTDVVWRVAILFQLEGYRFELRGSIRHYFMEQSWWKYGVEMDENPMMKTLIIRALNNRLLRSSPSLSRIFQLYHRTDRY